VLNNLREPLRPTLERIGRGFARTGLSPNFWTGTGLFFAFASGTVYGLEIRLGLIIGGILLLVSGFFDVVDGQVARITNETSKRGGFLDSVFDRTAEVAIYLGILIGGYVEPYLVYLAITTSLLVSYARSRAESLGVDLQGIGIGERAERLLVVSILGIVGGIFTENDFMKYAIIIVIVMAVGTFIQRIVVTARNLRN
jgi:archaetidylinositol phosphate synthase